MKYTKLAIQDVILLEPKLFSDNRGFFFESLHIANFENAVGYKVNFVQENHSYSIKNVLRGLHYQTSPKAQDKLVSVVSGKIFDVAVDLRQNSSTFGKYIGVELSADNKKQLWIPKGFAHGFFVMSEYAEMVYKVTDYYDPESERSILWNDPDIGIDWPLNCEKSALIISEKDLDGDKFRF